MILNPKLYKKTGQICLINVKSFHNSGLRLLDLATIDMSPNLNADSTSEILHTQFAPLLPLPDTGEYQPFTLHKFHKILFCEIQGMSVFGADITLVKIAHFTHLFTMSAVAV